MFPNRKAIFRCEELPNVVEGSPAKKSSPTIARAITTAITFLELKELTVDKVDPPIDRTIRSELHRSDASSLST